MLNIKNIYKTKCNYLNKIVKSFGLTEKTIFIILSLILVLSSISILVKLNSNFVTEIPAHGGSFTEGLVGSPRFINPLLEMSDADRDLTYLIYSGLMRATAEGDLIPDLAENYTISDDGLNYTFKIRDHAYFHDGTRVTTEDIEYTLMMAQDVSLRSPKRNNWLGVAINKISDREIILSLKQPYSPFLENLTLGILPKHLWSNANVDQLPFSDYNILPIGSGPYKITDIKKKGGIPNFYELKAFDKYTLGEPFITTIGLYLYQNEKELLDAYMKGEISNTSSFTSQSLLSIKENSNAVAENISLPRVFGVFFNQNQAKVFLNKEVRSALNMTVDKDRIVSEVLNGYGKKINGPLPNGTVSETADSTVYNKEEAIVAAKDLLLKNDWVLNESTQIWEKKISKSETQVLSFSISTSNTTDLKRVAEILKEDWSLLGANVEIQTFEPSDLNQSVISQRKYDALLFGEVVGRSLDLFAFWHSSQRSTGYNVALYTNATVDKLLEQARQTSDKEERLKKYAAFEEEIKKDIPAIFIYSPEFIYILPSKIKGFESGLINNRSERFQEIPNWYIETDNIWSFLSN